MLDQHDTGVQNPFANAAVLCFLILISSKDSKAFKHCVVRSPSLEVCRAHQTCSSHPHPVLVTAFLHPGGQDHRDLLTSLSKIHKDVSNLEEPLIIMLLHHPFPVLLTCSPLMKSTGETLTARRWG